MPKVVVTDHSKFGRSALVNVCGFEVTRDLFHLALAKVGRRSERRQIDLERAPHIKIDRPRQSDRFVEASLWAA